jgi:cytochrome c553
MLPRPKYLPDVIEEWSPAELFTIVKHGVKFTGMPAWPSQQRDDEVWAVVAFLLQFPKLDAQEYRLLVRGNPSIDTIDATIPRSIRDTCGRCHGADGRGRGGAFPKLAGQRASYLFNAMRAFREGTRHSGIMEPIAAALSTADMQEIALHYSRMQPSIALVQSFHNEAIARGRIIATRGIPAQRVPACADCHGPQPSKKNDAYPVLSGQHANYLVLQLQLFQQQRRGGSSYAHLMRPVAAGLTREQMRDVAAYYESLGGGGGGLSSAASR